jgi:hypothetical protein
MRQEMISAVSKFIYGILLSVLLASCSTAKRTETSTKSPDGRFSASVEITDQGAISKPSVRIVLHDDSDRIGEKDIELFQGKGGWPVKVHWVEPSTMVIEFCDGDNYEVRSGIFENKIIEATGKRSRFTTHVVTSSKDAYGILHFCK